MKDGNFLKEHNARHLWHPMAHPAEMQANPPDIIVGAEGVEIIDVDGHRVVDAVGGLWNVNLGYSCAPVKEAIARQLDRLPYYSIFRGTTNDNVIELAEMLRDFFAHDGLSRAFYTSGGSDSVEVALRLARQYHKLRGEAGRVKFLSLKKGYHGTHTLAASVNGNANFRTQYEPLMSGCYHVPAPYTYRNPFNETDPARLAGHVLAAIEDEIRFQDPSTIAAFIMEPVLGAGGVIPPHESFMPGVREICTKYGILLIADEIITAFGRTGDWSGSRHWGVRPDMMTTAKAITNGYFPFGALMISDEVAEVFEKDTTGKGAIASGYTYSGHPVGAAAAIACIKETLRLNVTENAAARGSQMFAGLEALKGKYEIIGDVRGGHGLMSALELVSDRATKAPIDKQSIAAVQRGAYAAGAMIRVSGNNIILSPPLVVSDADVNTILSALEAGLSTVS
ncbi:aminotransferase class III-fold pyridoxal phosphate-dependent enzyme [Defluviimonas sp. WL0002]|uniref:Aminotransferase class III-fold pyridoxal phosphate-dependent enzyme n=1 Tax=Albidovulum marisflavi TaxID=2984159 RepID=A0ABT2ZDS7_9RHOB|nr:aminotransferase class III-fold pyridoxal phosphate-dependent enzyme [Defluviimonas sp. WL0002]MCV2869269.1 aminotransferase class III-fold pyridoxal phosphate-dependent enzyme [Defluviimonas sp. WL0002]